MAGCSAERNWVSKANVPPCPTAVLGWTMQVTASNPTFNLSLSLTPSLSSWCPPGRDNLHCCLKHSVETESLHSLLSFDSRPHLPHVI